MNECVEVYKHLVLKHNPDNIIGVSTSAGCNHMLAILLKGKEMGLPMINSISLLSPYVDMEYNGDSRYSNNGRDLLAYKNMADKMIIKPFIGNTSLKDPFAFPINANHEKDSPATSIVTGTRDALMSDATRLFWKLKEVSVHTELLCSEGMWHAFTNFIYMPEAVDARKSSQKFSFNELQIVKNQNSEIVSRLATRQY